MAGPVPITRPERVALADFGDDPVSQWDCISRQYGTALKRYFGNRVNNPSDVADLVQKVFLRVLQRGEGPPIEHVQHYLFQVAASVLNDELRRSQVRHETVHETYDEAAHAPLTELSPERIAIGQEALERVAAVLRQLPDRTRDVYLLRVHQECEYRDIARQLGISERGAQRHMARALQQLEEQVGADMPTEALPATAAHHRGDSA